MARRRKNFKVPDSGGQDSFLVKLTKEIVDHYGQDSTFEIGKDPSGDPDLNYETVTLFLPFTQTSELVINYDLTTPWFLGNPDYVVAIYDVYLRNRNSGTKTLLPKSIKYPDLFPVTEYEVLIGITNSKEYIKVFDKIIADVMKFGFRNNPRKNPGTSVLGALILGGIIGHSMKKK